MRILAIRLARFGDIVLLLPALTWLKAQLPDSHLTFLTDARWAPLAAMCSAVDEVIAVDRIEMRDSPIWRTVPAMWRLMSDVRRRKFDAAIDCHGFRESSLLAWWSGAPQRLGLRRFDQSFFSFCFNLPPVVEDKGIHVSEMFLRLVRGFVPAGASVPSTPALVIPQDDVRWVKESIPVRPYAVLYVDAPVEDRVWPLQRFVTLADHIVKNLDGYVVVLSGSTRPLPKFREGVRVFTDLSIPQLAAVIGSARMLVSNDTGPMHLGPALGVPTVGIFSVGIPTHFRPTGTRDRYVQGNPIDKVTVEEVIAAANEVWSTNGR